MTFSSEDDGYRDLLGFPHQPATAKYWGDDDGIRRQVMCRQRVHAPL